MGTHEDDGDLPDAPAFPVPDGCADPSPSRFRSAKVDALFAGEPPPPPQDGGARILQLKRLLWVAVPLDLLGIPCCTGVPGAALTMWAWLLADEQMVRVENGEFSAEDAAHIMRLRAVARGAMVLCILSLILQIVLLSTPFYEELLAQVAGAVRRNR